MGNINIRLEEIKVVERNTIFRKFDTDVVVLFSNRVYRAISIQPLMSPDEIGKAFIQLGEDIIMDENLK